MTKLKRFFTKVSKDEFYVCLFMVLSLFIAVIGLTAILVVTEGWVLMLIPLAFLFKVLWDFYNA